jgi:hypothetical protein
MNFYLLIKSIINLLKNFFILTYLVNKKLIIFNTLVNMDKNLLYSGQNLKDYELIEADLRQMANDVIYLDLSNNLLKYYSINNF